MTNTIIIDGNLVRDPEIHFTQGGHAVANITIAHTPRTFNKAKDEWEDGETLFLTGSVWREAAENAVESYRKGQAVLVTGELIQRSYEKDGEKRTVIEVDIKNLGPSTLRATVTVEKNPPKNGKPAETRQAASRPSKGRAAEEPAEDESPF